LRPSLRFLIERRRRDDAKWTDRTGEDRAPVLFPVVPSLCFHTVFLAKRTDWTDWTGIAGGCSVRIGSACTSSHEGTRHGSNKHAAAGRDPSAFAVSTISKSGPDDCGKPHRPIAPRIAGKPPGRSRVLRRDQVQNRSARVCAAPGSRRDQPDRHGRRPTFLLSSTASLETRRRLRWVTAWTTALRPMHEPASREGRLVLRWRDIHRP